MLRADSRPSDFTGSHGKAIDLHTHIVPHAIPGYAGICNERRWPCIHREESGLSAVEIEGRRFRTISISAWDVTERIDAMDSMGIRYQVLSPMPELLSYWFNPQDTLTLARYVNSYIADMVARMPSRFIGFGMVPLQDPELAGRELEQLRSWGLLGVEIGTNVGGRPIGDHTFDPFLAAADALQTPILVHPLRPAGVERLIGPPSLEQAIAFPVETALAVASMITGGALERYAALRMAFSHGGGAFALMLPRLAHLWQTVPGIKDSVARSPVELAKRLFYDTLVYEPRALEYLIGMVGVSQLVIGTDYPFAIHERDPLGKIGLACLSAEDEHALACGNAARFLNLPLAS